MIVSTLLCLALNVFYETRNATAFDQQAVAAVALNRADATHKSVCHVIREPKQFSWTARHSLTVPNLQNPVERRAWINALKVARAVKNSKSIRQRFANVLYYHAHYVSPLWDRNMRVAFVTPFHTYYRI